MAPPFKRSTAPIEPTLGLRNPHDLGFAFKRGMAKAPAD